MGGIFSGAGDALDSAGKAEANVSLCCAFTFAIILCLSGSYYLVEDKDENYDKVNGTIINPKCVRHISYNGNKRPVVSYRCTFKVRYVYKNNEYLTTLTTNGDQRIDNENISLSVDKTNPNNVIPNRMSDISIAVIVFAIAIILVSFAGCNYYMTYHSKLYSELQGANLAVSGTRSVVRAL